MPIFGPVWALGPKKGGTYKIKIFISYANSEKNTKRTFEKNAYFNLAPRNIDL